MTQEQTSRSLPERPPRYCPVCGARVAEGAKTCLMCGAPLTTQPPQTSGETTDQEEPSSEHKISPFLRTFILTLIAILVLSGSVVLGLNLSQGGLSPASPTLPSTPTSTPTATATPTLTPTPTETPLPTATPTPIPPIEYTVQAGDTLLGIALKYNLTTDEIMAYNNLSSDIIVAGQTLLIPPPVSTAGPSPTPEPGKPTVTPAPFILYTVRSGDTLSTIAEQYGVSVDAIRTANNIPEGSETIQVNQVLMIPRNTPTPTPRVIVATTPTPTPGLMRYPPPPMLYPPEGQVFSGPDAVIALQWASVGILDRREYYEVELIAPGEESNKTIRIYTRATAWRVPSDLFPAETITKRTFAWRVFVVRQVTGNENSEYKIISAAPRRRTFIWSTE